MFVGTGDDSRNVPSVAFPQSRATITSNTVPDAKKSDP
jgi:hypothetical protein